MMKVTFIGGLLCIRHCYKGLMYNNSLNLHKACFEMNTSVILFYRRENGDTER